ncbi:MEKHLA domain-containing protein [Aliiroseovarius sp.]|uniref:MEKHLA domain-containing protein n=1 Tax=Aliiroseovarius sp. TaxID=1872442 RepID=UPI003BABC646
MFASWPYCWCRNISIIGSPFSLPISRLHCRDETSLLDSNHLQRQIFKRLTAEPDERAARAAMLASITERGFIDDYSGIRISTKGRRFYIDQAVIWTLRDTVGHKLGQAAAFAKTRPA